MTDTLQNFSSFPQEVQSFSILELFSQAGGFQWPILAVLIAGLIILMLRMVRLIRDDLAARPLKQLSLDSITLSALLEARKRAADSLYTQLLSGLIQLHRNPEAMGREVSDIATASHAAYERTQRIVNYCSSTAGGLGLLGTLVGIYALFSTGTRDAQTIFAGIAIAVVSTLLGIITSILLEFFEAVMHGYVSRYIESAQMWAQKVRSYILSITEGDV
ncbi:MAG: MotA/TolQ/ExbB proton channel family protein [Bacteroidetes bacterium]|nr:MotA/TolQ/ExbB proton channel family protein [Bacteroidota bacterium]MCY4205131.1 MotA/TolQ/ExbB proton channel family protein [Bacteroidota bacterium]